MNTKSKNRKQWGQTLLAAIGIFIASLLITLLIMMQSEPWAQWAWILSCWVSILTFAAIPLLFLSYLSGDNFPETDLFFEGTPWAIIGGITIFGVFFFLTQSSCCYKGDVYMLACFGPLVGLMGFGVGGYLRNHFPFFALTLSSPIIASYLQPLLGNQLTIVIAYVVALVPAGISLYLRLRRIARGDTLRMSLPAPTQIIDYRHCPQCNVSWKLEPLDIEHEERCPTCGWSWKETTYRTDFFDIPSHLIDKLPKRIPKQNCHPPPNKPSS